MGTLPARIEYPAGARVNGPVSFAIIGAAGAWARGEASGPYSLADACQDHLLGLAIEESARMGADVLTSIESWAETA